MKIRIMFSLICLVIALLMYQCGSGSWSNLMGSNVAFKTFTLDIKSVRVSNESPYNKIPAPEHKHYIIIETSLAELTKDATIATDKFFLEAENNEKFVKPGSWGKIEVMGSLSNFESSSGARVYIRKIKESVNLFFLVSNKLKPVMFRLMYEN